MNTEDTHRLAEFALTITSADNDRSQEGERARRIELFRSPDGTVFADLYDGANRQTWPVSSKTFSHWLARTYFATANKIAKPSQLKAAINQIEAQAQHGTPEREVFLRVGEFGHRLYLDLADEQWRAIEIDAAGWRVVQRPPVRFVRTPGMLPLPVPEKGGSIATLRSLVNVRDEHDFVLVVAWLLAALRRNIAKPIIALRGGEGSAKSTLVEIVRRLIDPHQPAYTGLPRTDLKLRAAAAECYLQAFDNVSGLTGSMSDAVCRFVTDGSNQPVIINGISDIVTRPDLGDRCVFIDCAPIPDVQRRTQADVMTAFASQRPKVLGVLLDAVVHGLRNEAQTKPTGLPRMADFALAVTACETMFWPTGTFRTAYDINRAEIVEAMTDADPVASAVRLLMVHRGFWEGQASDLDNTLRAITGNLEGAKNWPADPRILANTLRRLTPSPMKIGIDVTLHRSRDRGRKRLITITASGPDPAIREDAISASASSAPASGREEPSGGDHASAMPHLPTTSEPLAPNAEAVDAADAAEAEKSNQSNASPPNVTPQPADGADVGSKYRTAEFVSDRFIGGRRIPVLRYRRPG